MKKFCVLVREVHVAYRQVEADNEKEALDKVKEGEGEDILLEYSHTLDPDTWTVEEKE